jgi:DNA-binding Lrp family transcriptional regulator
MTTKQKARIYEKRVLKAIKKAQIVEGYYVISYTALARELGISYTAVVNAIKRLHRKDIIEEIKKSFGLFGSMFKIGIKICPSELDKMGCIERKEKNNTEIAENEKRGLK